jgi:hypothetical protein
MTQAIQVWHWRDAPLELQQLSRHGGDEEGVALIPPGVEEPWFLEKMWDFYGPPERHDTPDGEVVIWAH